VPPVPVSTADAYAALADATRGSFPQRGRLTDVAPTWQHIAAVAHNDFESVIFRRMPLLAELRDVLHESGAIVARMTGSGSVVFGVFDSESTLDDARDHITAAFPDVQCIATRTAMR
jgi:4-diphosphocytidyl-2-C-methyl-D-erythritol kinase